MNYSLECDRSDNITITSTQPITNHVYTKEGCYNVTLTVVDDRRIRNLITKTLTVDTRAHTLPTDLNQDGVVSILDVFIVARAFGSKQGDPLWNSIADLDQDGTVSILDVSMIARDYGKKA